MEKSKKWTKEFLEKEKERIKKLRENEPKIEPKHPYELFGIECDKGWEKLYQPIIDYIEDYNKDKEGDDRIEILQIKEKFGYLTIYVSKKTDELRSMIEDAEADSYHTCEVCGKHINKPIVEHHWIYAECQECHDKWKKDRQKKMDEAYEKKRIKENLENN